MEWSRKETERSVSGTNITSASITFYGEKATYDYSGASWGNTQYVVNLGETKILLLEDYSWDIYGEGYGDSGFITNLSTYSIIIDGVTVVDQNKLHVKAELITIDNIEYTIQYTSKDVSSFN